MNTILKPILCDFVAPTITETLAELIQDNLVAVVILLVALLLVAAIITISILSRKADQESQNNLGVYTEIPSPETEEQL